MQYKHTQYFVSKEGVITNRHGKALRQSFNDKYKYKSVCLRIDNVTKGMYVHRIVAELYVSNPENKPFVNHIDGNKHNNSADNLEWVTHEENMRHAFKTGLIKSIPNYKGKSGCNHNRSIEVRQLSKEREVLNIYNGYSDASRKTGIRVSSIHYSANNNTFLKGFFWECDNLTIRQKRVYAAQGKPSVLQLNHI